MLKNLSTTYDFKSAVKKNISFKYYYKKSEVFIMHFYKKSEVFYMYYAKKSEVLIKT